MHNSLFIRDLLARTNTDPLRLERRNPHRAVAWDPAARPGPGEFRLEGAWGVDGSVSLDINTLIEDDLYDFLARMGVETSPAAPYRIDVRLQPSLGPRACRLECQPDEVAIIGGDLAGLWAGVAWLEWEMRTRRGPILPEGIVEHHAAWPVQISQGPWGGNYSVPDFAPAYLSDDAFRLYAHFGVNNMMIYGDLLCYTDSAILPELSHPDAAHNLEILADAARRAARFGVQFSYVVVGPKLRPDHPVFANHPHTLGSGIDFGSGPIHFLCSSNAQVLAFYEECFTRLFTAVPELAGLTLIIAGESMYHCRMWQGRDGFIPCPRCQPQVQETVIANMLGAVRTSVTTVKPEAYVAAWAYTAWNWDRPDREEFVRQLPDGVAFYHHIEKDQSYRKDGYTKHIWDYSVDFTGPSDDLRRLAPIAREGGNPLFVKTETGIGLEVFQFPYVPGMQRLAEKWQHVRDLTPAGVQQSWLFFGMCGSRAEELGLWAAYRPEMSAEDYLRAMAVRDFGPAAAEAVVAAWAHMSAALGHLPSVILGPCYYIGPSFLGPAHPLVPAVGDAVPEIFDAHLYYLQELEETFSHKTIDVARQCLVMDTLPDTTGCLYLTPDDGSDGWGIVVREYTVAACEAETAWRLLHDAECRAATAMDARNLREESLLTELVYRTFLACENTIRFLLARRDGDREEMRRLALLERDNALAAIPIYAHSPWLDLAERTDGTFNKCVDMLQAKVAWIEEAFGEVPERGIPSRM
jgi:hypothetical protein